MAGVVATTALDMSTGLNIGYWSGSTQVVANSTYIQGTSQDTMYRGKYLGSSMSTGRDRPKVEP